MDEEIQKIYKLDCCSICFELLDHDCLVQCGHFLHLSCESKLLKPKNCPLCRKRIEKTIPIKMPVIKIEANNIFILNNNNDDSSDSKAQHSSFMYDEDIVDCDNDNEQFNTKLKSLATSLKMQNNTLQNRLTKAEMESQINKQKKAESFVLNDNLITLGDDMKKISSEKHRIDAQNAKLLEMNQRYSNEKEKLSYENDKLAKTVRSLKLELLTKEDLSRMLKGISIDVAKYAVDFNNTRDLGELRDQYINQSTLLQASEMIREKLLREKDQLIKDNLVSIKELESRKNSLASEYNNLASLNKINEKKIAEMSKKIANYKALESVKVVSHPPPKEIRVNPFPPKPEFKENIQPAPLIKQIIRTSSYLDKAQSSLSMTMKAVRQKELDGGLVTDKNAEKLLQENSLKEKSANDNILNKRPNEQLYASAIFDPKNRGDIITPGYDQYGRTKNIYISNKIVKPNNYNNTIDSV